MKFPYGYKSDIRSIKAAGFGGFKIELEANLDRSGDWDEEAWASEADCEEFIRARLSGSHHAALAYLEFYNDGSVDSEITATYPVEQAHLGIELIHALLALADEIGNGLSIEGAGMHLTLLPDTRYPSQTRLDRDKLANFTAQMNKLMPALFAASTHNGQTRGWHFRKPEVSPSKGYQNYPAICTHDSTCLEFRVFDPCYDQPEALLEKIQIMARALEFYSDKQVNLKSSRFTLNLGERQNGEICDSLNNLENLRALNETIQYLKPKGTSMQAFKMARNLDVKVAGLRAKARKMRHDMRFEYEAYRLEWRAAELRRFGEWVRRQPTDSLFSTKMWLSVFRLEVRRSPMYTFTEWAALNVDQPGLTLTLN